MDKTAQLEVDKPMVLRHLLGGALVGGSGAAVVNLAHMLREMQEKRRKREEREVLGDKNTITLTLPPKRAVAESYDDIANAADVKSKAEKRNKLAVTQTRTTTTQGPDGQNQARRYNGTFGIKTAQEEGGWLDKALGTKPVGPPRPANPTWPTLTGRWAGATAGVAAGALIVNKVYAVRRKKQLERQLAKAKEEYLDKLDVASTSKLAEDIDSIFVIPVDVGTDMDKSAQENLTAGIRYPLAYAAFLALIGTGGSAYLTKKYLDDRYKSEEKKLPKAHKIQRIVFKSSPKNTGEVTSKGKKDNEAEVEEEHEVTAEDMSCLRSAFAVMCDVVEDKPNVLGSPAVREELEKLGETPEGLMKRAANEPELDALLNWLKGQPELRERVQRMYIEQHPSMQGIQGWAAEKGMGTKAGRRVADNKTYDFVTDMYNEQGGIDGIVEMLMPMLQKQMSGGGGAPQIDPATFVPEATPVASTPATPSPTPAVNGMPSKPWLTPSTYNPIAEGHLVRPAAKVAGVLASVIGSNIAEQGNAEELTTAIVDAQHKLESEAAEKRDRPSIDELVAKIELSGADPGADAYIDANRAKILAVLQAMGAEGQLASAGTPAEEVS